MIASEAYPFVKSGGLGDVLGSLPKALRDAGVDVRVVIPKYKDIDESYQEQMTHLADFQVDLAWRNQFCGIEMLEYQGVPIYFVDNEYYFNRKGLYGFFDEAERYAFFSKAVLEMLPYIDFMPDVLHAHDWQTSLTSVYLKTRYAKRDGYKDMKSILTIHNLKYQGVFAKEVLGDVLDLDENLFHKDFMEFNGAISFLKGGIIFSDMVTTVSKTYAEEIKTAYYGEKMEDVLSRIGDIRGIVNGIDYRTFNPLKDPTLYKNYKSSFKSKQENKEPLQKELGLTVDKSLPMMVFISRLVEQKGLDLILRVIPEIIAEGIQLVVLGTGDENYHLAFLDFVDQYPGQLSINLFYSEELAHKLYAASDMTLLPSKYEPCGLTQLIALRYGSVPIVRETGGLADTVKSYWPETGDGNGFSFSNYNAHDMLHTIRRAMTFYRKPKEWQKIVKNAMDADNSWKNSAAEYLALYEGLS
jgi:starch synthase